ncbi:putative ribonuclease H-like domain-containing protein [Tanacetum coccineum]
MLADSLLPTVLWAEVVNTACYIMNRVLVTKPHNKAPYELIIGRPPSISFMRPFGCPVTILNTLDPLGKFDGKAEEGFLVGYSVNRKAFRKSIDARQYEGKNMSTQQYIVFPLWSSISSSYKSSDETYKKDTTDDAAGETPVQKPASKNEQALKNVLDKMMDQKKEASEQSDAVRKEFEAQCNRELLQRKATKASNTNSFNTVSTPVNAASAPRTSNDAGPSFVPFGGSFPLNVNDLPDDSLMSDLENTVEVQNTGILAVEAMQEELLQFKIKKVWTLVDLPYGKKVIGTKWVYRNKKDERGIVVRNKFRLVAQGYKQEKGIDYNEVFAPVARIEAIRLFLAYTPFMNLLVYKMDVKSAFFYGTIDEEVYVSQPSGFMDPEFPEKVYKVEKALYGLHKLLELDDIIFGSTKKSLCTDFEQIMHKRFQMSSIGELTFFLGLQVKQKEDGIFISQDKYVGEILKKFGFFSIRTTNTPMETNKALTKDEDGEDVDVHLYRSMIGSLMYLTSSRPDIMFSICACSRFQVQPKVSHLNAVKRIFRYLKGRPNLGLWYPKDSPFILKAFLDSDYACASLDRKSTIGGCQFLGSRLIFWQCKKQTVVANSTTEAEYIAASQCCGQNPVYHSKIKHIEIRHHFIRDSYEKRLIEMVKIHIDNNVADLLTKAFDGRLMVYKCSGLYTSAIWIEVGMDYNWSERRALKTSVIELPHLRGEVDSRI